MLKKILSIIFCLVLIFMGVDLYVKNIKNLQEDKADAPNSYGKPIHYKPSEGPYFGLLRGDNDLNITVDSFAFAMCDNNNGKADEDAFKMYAENDKEGISKYYSFAPDILAENAAYVINIPIAGAELDDPVRGWIDFNGNGKFEDDEKASTMYKGGSFVTLNWRLPDDLMPMLTYIRLRTCKKTYLEKIESPVSLVETGEVEDHVVRISKASVPTMELKEYLDFTPFNGVEGLVSVNNKIKQLAIGKINIHAQITGLEPEIVGINNMHDGSVTGIRLGHDSFPASKENPIILSMKADALLENINFQIIDIDGGDRVKIKGFNNKVPVHFDISNLTDKYYYQFNVAENEIYSSISTDAGNGDEIPSSLNMGINVNFKSFVDSIVIIYSDDLPVSSGTFTIGNFSARKYRLPPVLVQSLTSTEGVNKVTIDWKLAENNSLLAYSIQRSFDGKGYEEIKKEKISNQQVFSFEDTTIPTSIKQCYYRIKFEQTDHYISYSNILRFKKTESQSLLGFTTTSPFFKKDFTIVFLKDMLAPTKVTLYNYAGIQVKEWSFANKHIKETLTLNGLEDLPEDIYYIQIIYDNNNYHVELSNNK